VSNWRTLYEGPDWQNCREKIQYSAARFDDEFRFAAENIATKPLVNSTPFLTENHRILRTALPDVAELWIYFRIDGENAITLLWMEERKLEKTA
jgi:hypothetical protein